MTSKPHRSSAHVRAREVAIFASVFEAMNDTTPALRFGTLFELLGDEHLIDDVLRRQEAGYSCAEFRPGGTRRRADVLRLSAVVLDYDDLREADASRLFSTLKSKGLAFAAHTTHRHLQHDLHRYRVVIPLARPASPEQYDATVRKLVAEIAVKVDPAVFDPSHRWLFPARADTDEAEEAAYFEYLDGHLLEPEIVASAPSPVPPSILYAPPPISFDLDSLRAWLVAHPSPQSELQQATLAICRGEPWDDDDSGRDRMLFRTLSSIALRAPGVTEAVLVEFIEQSVRAVQAEGSKVNMRVARAKVRAVLAKAAVTPRYTARPPRKPGKRVRLWRVQAFVSGMFDLDEKGTVSGLAFQNAYEAWADANGGRLGKKARTEELRRLGIESRKVNGSTFWPVRFKARPQPGPGPHITPEEEIRSRGGGPRVGVGVPPRAPPPSTKNRSPAHRWGSRRIRRKAP